MNQILTLLALVVFLSFLPSVNADFLQYQEYHPETIGSRFSQIHVLENNVYVLWQESTHGQYYFDLLFRKSDNYGKTFGDTINLTDGKGFYPEAQIKAVKNYVYVIWKDDDSQNPKVFLKRSTDFGNTFEDVVILSPTDSFFYSLIGTEIANQNLYVFMSKYDPATQKSTIVFTKSQDNGKTFGEMQTLFEFEKRFDYFDTESENGVIHTVVNGDGEYEEAGKVLYRKIDDKNGLGQVIQLNENGSSVFGPQVSLSDNNVYVIWRQIMDKKHSLVFTKSVDGGISFAKPIKLNKDPNSVDVVWSVSSQIESNGNNVYIVWPEEYYDGKTQSFHEWFATSTDGGDTFDVKLHPLDDAISSYYTMQMREENSNLYLIWSMWNYTSTNEAETYFAKSTDGINFDTNNITYNIREQINNPRMEISENNIYIVGDADSEKHCLYFTSSNDGGNSFGRLVDINDYTPHEKCVKLVQLAIFSPLKQMRGGIAPDQIVCPNDTVLIFKKNNGNPACVSHQTREKLLLRGAWTETTELISLISEPRTKILVEVGDRINQRGLVPITVSEITENAASLDTITVWNFIPLRYNGDNIGKEWDILPSTHSVWYSITDEKENPIVDESRMPDIPFGIPADLHGYELYCGNEIMVAESAHPTGFPIKSTNIIIAKNAERGIYPNDNGEYTVRLASLFEQEIKMPDDAKTLSQRHESCITEFQGNLRNGYYDEVTFRLE